MDKKLNLNLLLISSLLVFSCASATEAYNRPIEKEAVPLSRQAQGSPVTVDQIRHAWQQREAQVRYGRFVWDEKRILTKRHVRWHVRMAGLDYDVTEDMVVDVPGVSVAFADGKIRYATEPASSGIADRTFAQSISTFDGQDSRSYVPPSAHHVGGIEWGGMGIVGAESRYDDVGIFGIRPILLMYRPLHKDMLNLDLDTFHILNGFVHVKSRQCIVLETVAPSGLTSTIWLDLERAFLPVRFRQSRDGRVLVQSDMEYRQDERYGWLPEFWENSIFNTDGSLDKSTRATVVQAVINERIADEAFHVEFPPGTRVTNKRTEESYFISTDGEHLPYDTPVAHQRKSMWQKSGWLLAIGFALTLGALAFLVRSKCLRED